MLCASNPLAREGLRGERRARADAAVEDHRPVPIDRLGRLAQLGELEVAGTGDAPGVVLVGLAHVDELDRALGVQLGHALGRQLPGVRLGVHSPQSR